MNSNTATKACTRCSCINVSVSPTVCMVAHRAPIVRPVAMGYLAHDQVTTRLVVQQYYRRLFTIHRIRCGIQDRAGEQKVCWFDRCAQSLPQFHCSTVVQKIARYRRPMKTREKNVLLYDRRHTSTPYGLGDRRTMRCPTVHHQAHSVLPKAERERPNTNHHFSMC